jgi:hypothetical protein
MSIVTLDRVRPASVDAARQLPTARRRLWARFLERFIQAREKQAMEQIRRHHRFAFPRELDDASWKAAARSEDSLPLVR